MLPRFNVGDLIRLNDTSSNKFNVGLIAGITVVPDYPYFKYLVCTLNANGNKYEFGLSHCKGVYSVIKSNIILVKRIKVGMDCWVSPYGRMVRSKFKFLPLDNKKINYSRRQEVDIRNLSFRLCQMYLSVTDLCDMLSSMKNSSWKTFIKYFKIRSSIMFPTCILASRSGRSFSSSIRSVKVTVSNELIAKFNWQPIVPVGSLGYIWKPGKCRLSSINNTVSLFKSRWNDHYIERT